MDAPKQRYFFRTFRANVPKISVLIPLYDRKDYIAQAVDSVLNQTFQDFEIIIRDDGSTDGSADFVAERYAKQISSGKIKLRRNEENLGEFPTDNRLVREATGKYFMILHSDDVYLPHALEHMYSVAEKYNADVVHSMTRLITDEDGVIEVGSKLSAKHTSQFNCIYNGNDTDKILLVPNDPDIRFDEWFNVATFIDAQYNIFRREFIMDNNLLFWEHGQGIFSSNRFFTLHWLLKANVFVKTPQAFYIHRDLPNALSNQKMPPERVAQFIDVELELSRYLDEYFASEEFFRDSKKRQYLARSNLFSLGNAWRIKRNGVYKYGITPDLNDAIEEVFKKHFGNDYAFPTFLFHWINVLLEKRSVKKLNHHPPEETQET